MNDTFALLTDGPDYNPNKKKVVKVLRQSIEIPGAFIVLDEDKNELLVQLNKFRLIWIPKDEMKNFFKSYETTK